MIGTDLQNGFEQRTRVDRIVAGGQDRHAQLMRRLLLRADKVRRRPSLVILGKVAPVLVQRIREKLPCPILASAQARVREIRVRHARDPVCLRHGVVVHGKRGAVVQYHLHNVVLGDLPAHRFGRSLAIDGHLREHGLHCGLRLCEVLVKHLFESRRSLLRGYVLKHLTLLLLLRGEIAP